MSQPTSVIPKPSGAHQRRNSSAWLHALNTISRGASKVRVTTSSRSDFLSTSVRLLRRRHYSSADPSSSSCFISKITLQRVEPRFEQLALGLDPFGLALEAACLQPAGPHPPTFLRGDQPRPLEHATCFFMPVSVMWNLSARLVIEASDRPSCSSTPRRVASDSAANDRSREGLILNHIVQYLHGWREDASAVQRLARRLSDERATRR